MSFQKNQWLDFKDAVTYSYSPSFSKSDTFPSLNERPWPDSFPSSSEMPNPLISELNKFPYSNEKIIPKTSATDNIALAEQFLTKSESKIEIPDTSSNLNPTTSKISCGSHEPTSKVCLSLNYDLSPNDEDPIERFLPSIKLQPFPIQDVDIGKTFAPLNQKMLGP